MWHPHLKKKWLNNQEFEIIDYKREQIPSFLQLLSPPGRKLRAEGNKRKLECKCKFTPENDLLQFHGKTEQNKPGTESQENNRDIKKKTVQKEISDIQQKNYSQGSNEKEKSDIGKNRNIFFENARMKEIQRKDDHSFTENINAKSAEGDLLQKVKILKNVLNPKREESIETNHLIIQSNPTNPVSWPYPTSPNPLSPTYTDTVSSPIPFSNPTPLNQAQFQASPEMIQLQYPILQNIPQKYLPNQLTSNSLVPPQFTLPDITQYLYINNILMQNLQMLWAAQFQGLNNQLVVPFNMQDLQNVHKPTEISKKNERFQSDYHLPITPIESLSVQRNPIYNGLDHSLMELAKLMTSNPRTTEN